MCIRDRTAVARESNANLSKIDHSVEELTLLSQDIAMSQRNVSADIRRLMKREAMASIEEYQVCI